MIASLNHFLKGYVTIRVEGNSPERFVNLCAFHKIYMWDLVPAKQSYSMNMELNDFRKIRPFAKKTHTKIRIINRIGFPFFLYRYEKRKLFFAGAFLCILILCFLSSRIWDIHFEGNDKWTEDILMDYLKSNDVKPSMPRNKVNCEKIVKDIRKEYDDIVWVSASLEGCVLKIHIKENEDTFRESLKDQDTPQDLVATKEGVITKIITRKGSPCVHVGDHVSKGDVLVSGKIEITNDSQEVVGYKYLKADADVYADTTMKYKDSVNQVGLHKNYEDSLRGIVYLKAGNYFLKAGTLTHHFEEWESFAREKTLKLGENFQLPIAVGYQVIRPYTTKKYARSKKEIQKELSLNYGLFSKELEQKGIQIRKKDVKIHMNKNTASAQGILYLNEKITKEADINNSEIKGENLDESGRNDDGVTG